VAFFINVRVLDYRDLFEGSGDADAEVDGDTGAEVERRPV
jgi:hypothetical protein